MIIIVEHNRQIAILNVWKEAKIPFKLKLFLKYNKLMMIVSLQQSHNLN